MYNLGSYMGGGGEYNFQIHRFVMSPPRPERLRVSPSLLSNGY